MTAPPDVVPLRTPTLRELSVGIGIPDYPRGSLRPGIVHLGVGGFHRAHLATYADELATSGATGWGILGAGVLPSDRAMAEVLAAQDHLYTLIVRGAETTTVTVIGSLIGYVLACDDPTPLVEAIAAPSTQIVSLTVTEGGYPVDDTTGDYDPESRVAGEGSAFAILARGLEARRQAGGQPVTVLSCDNIMSNGDAARSATLGEAAAVGAELVEWVGRSVSFPNSMVDRITPATTPEDGDWLERTHQLHDGWPVVTEPFRQWVIEDDFAGERPPLEQLDVIVTGDVEPYELMKLRLLNAGHSCMAYLSSLAGHDTVDAAVADPAIRTFLHDFLELEARPVLPAIAGVDLDAYVASLIERFSNPQIGDQIERLCLDGSAKFPKFLLPTVRAQLAAGGPIGHSALALAGWCEYLTGRHRSAPPAPDPQLDAAREWAAASIEVPGRFLEFVEVFGPDLANGRFADAFGDALGRLRSGGVASALATIEEAGRPE